MNRINTKIIKSFILIKILIVMVLVLYKYLEPNEHKLMMNSQKEIMFGDNVLGYGQFIVPNIVHFIRFGSESHFLDFVSFITIKSVLINQRPEKIYIHCNCTQMSGKYWHFIQHEDRIIVRSIKMPTNVFGHEISKLFLEWHASDVTRLKVLMQFGGIYLDNDVYVLKKLDKFRVYEMSIGWDKTSQTNELLGNQVLIAHKNARFLQIWHNLYRQYDPSKWYYNGGELPSQELVKNPQLIHRVNTSLGVDGILFQSLYAEFDSKLWNEYDLHSIHLLMKHRYYLDKNFSQIPDFDENNIKTYPNKFGQLARLMYYGTQHIIN